MRGRRTKLFGHCASAALLEAGAVRSTHDPSAFHGRCRGAARRPDGPGGIQQMAVCDCQCHAGQEVAPAPPVVRSVIAGKRDSKLLNQWAATLHQTGRLEVDAPSDDRLRASMMGRMRTAGKRAGLKVKIRERSGRLIAEPVAL